MTAIIKVPKQSQVDSERPEKPGQHTCSVPETAQHFLQLPTTSNFQIFAYNKPEA